MLHSAALREKQGITLIHGPPGTGKTTTILSLVGAYFAQLGMKMSTPGPQKQFKFAVLICAASNGAVDNILARFEKSNMVMPAGVQQKKVRVRYFHVCKRLIPESHILLAQFHFTPRAYAIV